jgi:membrane protease subunit HflK
MPQKFEFPTGKPVPSLNFTPRTAYLVLAAIAALWVLSGVYKIGPDEQGVVLRFGKLEEVAEPGLHYHLPNPIEELYKRSVTQVYSTQIGFRIRDPGPPARYSDVPKESLMLTGDENIIDVELVVQYRVSNIVDALFNVEGLGVFENRRGSGGLVHDASEAVLRQVIGKHTLDEALTEGKQVIQDEIKLQLQSLFTDTYRCGLTVRDVLLQQVVPPSEVAAAFKDVISAKEDRERLVNEARGYQNDVIPKARGEAEKRTKAAEGYRIDRVRTSRGDADRFTAVYAEYKKAPNVTERRLYIETMEKILPDLQKYIVDTGEGGGLLNILNLSREGLK